MFLRGGLEHLGDKGVGDRLEITVRMILADKRALRKGRQEGLFHIRKGRRQLKPELLQNLQRPFELSAVVADPPGDDSDLLTRLAALPERQRLVVFLRYYADLDYREIAEALDVKVGTVSATLHAAHGSLRSALSEVSG
jgi:DNA-directed RNA polymerase specialized sigma24 family protein